MPFFSVLLKPHLLEFGHRLSDKRLQYWLMLNHSLSDYPLVFFQVLVGILPPRIPIVLHLPLFHLSRILAARGVNGFVCNGALWAAVVLSQALGPIFEPSFVMPVVIKTNMKGTNLTGQVNNANSGIIFLINH